MANSLSAYWANFFKGAGFTNEVAMKHALVFSNNRIKPDMLSDLDKPSLKEMGITLMGDMIAILRYAKKVVEENSCQKFIIDSEQTLDSPKKSTKVVQKKVVAKPVVKTGPSTLKADSTTTKKAIVGASVLKAKKIVAKKPISSKSDIAPEPIAKAKQVGVKRKLTDNDDSTSVEDTAFMNIKKAKSIELEDNARYTVMLPKPVTPRNEQIIRKCQEQKQTVFDRLGDECTETTTSANGSSTTFNITGLGKDIFKRSPSVFNRLGDKDGGSETTSTVRILQNGTREKITSGILKTQSPISRTCLITTKQVTARSGGTMRADQEQNKKKTSIVNPIKKPVAKIQYNNSSIKEKRYSISNSSLTKGKLASEQPPAIPAKARLGLAKPGNISKQVTFSNTTTVTHYSKPNVFSRLG